MTKSDSFDWVDVLLKRWQIIVILVGSVVWLTTLQAQLNASTIEQVRMGKKIEYLSDMGAEWPYLKQKVDKMDVKLDILLNRRINKEEIWISQESSHGSQPIGAKS